MLNIKKAEITFAARENPTRKKACIAKELGLTPSTLNSIVAKRIEIEENARTFDVKCKQARSSEHVQLDKAVFEWFKQARAAGVNFDGTILRERALEIADKLDDTTEAVGDGAFADCDELNTAMETPQRRTAPRLPIHRVPSCFVLLFSSSGFAVYSNGTDCSFVFAHDDELPSADVAFDDLRAGGVLIPAEITLEGFADADKDLELCPELTDDEIIHQVTEDSDDSDTENEEPAPTQPTNTELTRALMTLSLVYSGNMTLTEIEADIIAGKRTVQKKNKRLLCAQVLTYEVVPATLRIPANVRLTATKNGWMTSEKMQEWLSRVWGPNVDNVRRLLVLDQAPIHKTQATTNAFEEYNTDVLYVPAGCTSVLQPADVYWNKPFKSTLRRLWEQYMREEARTPKGNLKKPSRQHVLEFVAEAWAAVTEETVARSFKGCGASNALDGSEDCDLRSGLDDVGAVVPEDRDGL
ncbi:hypothetical protein HPB52_014777 [Rhipicephalus sanguineus]|uniref:Transposase n=1 Tax=Rhipicephalus sanguineus TaxID=34632 RepID=A0A9D4PJ63_RHISA|nr:hypothetical protein HPB52_014777 [Rhipicephalus sanguineus]